jgi:hypothetical protein
MASSPRAPEEPALTVGDVNARSHVPRALMWADGGGRVLALGGHGDRVGRGLLHLLQRGLHRSGHGHSMVAAAGDAVGGVRGGADGADDVHAPLPAAHARVRAGSAPRRRRLLGRLPSRVYGHRRRDVR